MVAEQTFITDPPSTGVEAMATMSTIAMVAAVVVVMVAILLS